MACQAGTTWLTKSGAQEIVRNIRKLFPYEFQCLFKHVPAPIGNLIFTNEIYFFMTYFNESPSKLQYIYPVVFNVRKTKNHNMNSWIKIPQTVSSCILNSFLTKENNSILVSRVCTFCMASNWRASCTGYSGFV